jgi:hypothetical protein
MRSSRLYAALFWVIWIVIALLTQATHMRSDRIAIAGGLGMYVLPVILYAWCKADAAARSVQPPPGAIPLLAVLLPVGWAYYVFATRSPLRAVGVIIGGILAASGIMAVSSALLSDRLL